MKAASALVAACLVMTACSPSETVKDDRPLSAPEAQEADGPAPDAAIVDIPMDSVDGNDEVPQDQGVVESDR